MTGRSTKRFEERKIFHRTVDFELRATESGRGKNICFKGDCIDISEGGLGLTTRCVLKEGEVLRLQLPVRDIDITIPVLAEVIWTKSVVDQYRTGVRFFR